MPVKDVLSNLAALGTVGVSLLAGVVGFILQSTIRPNVAVPTLEERLKDLGQTMRTSAELLTTVQAEIEARAARAERLAEEVQTAERLAELNKAERDAVARLVRAEIAGESKRSARRDLLINGLFFVAGIAASVAVTLFVHPF